MRSLFPLHLESVPMWQFDASVSNMNPSFTSAEGYPKIGDDVRATFNFSNASFLAFVHSNAVVFSVSLEGVFNGPLIHDEPPVVSSKS